MENILSSPLPDDVTEVLGEAFILSAAVPSIKDEEEQQEILTRFCVVTFVCVSLFLILVQ